MVTLSGSTESERQQAINKRKKETEKSPLVTDRESLLDRVDIVTGKQIGRAHV